MFTLSYSKPSLHSPTLKTPKYREDQPEYRHPHRPYGRSDSSEGDNIELHDSQKWQTEPLSTFHRGDTQRKNDTLFISTNSYRVV